MNRNNKYLTLVRREFWEHRSLWLVPTIIAGLLLCAAMFAGPHFGNGNGIDFNIHPAPPPGASPHVGASSLLGVLGLLGLFACIVGASYLLDGLFAERKDRSILFWKSLPVSDAETVLTKLVVAMVLMPLLVLVLAVLLQPLLAGVVALRFPEARPQVLPLLGEGLTAIPDLVMIGVFMLLWYAPVATYLMLASVLAKRVPVVYAAMPPVALVVAEQFLFGSGHVFRFIAARLVPWSRSGQQFLAGTDSGWMTMDRNWWRLFADPKLWLGLVAAAAMVLVVIRLRRYRDDT